MNKNIKTENTKNKNISAKIIGDKAVDMVENLASRGELSSYINELIKCYLDHSSNIIFEKINSKLGIKDELFSNAKELDIELIIEGEGFFPEYQSYKGEAVLIYKKLYSIEFNEKNKVQRIALFYKICEDMQDKIMYINLKISKLGEDYLIENTDALLRKFNNFHELEVYLFEYDEYDFTDKEFLIEKYEASKMVLNFQKNSTNVYKKNSKEEEIIKPFFYINNQVKIPKDSIFSNIF